MKKVTQTPEEIKQAVKDDLYWVLEGISGWTKSRCREFMNDHFEGFYTAYGDTETLYQKFIEKAGLHYGNK